MMPSVSSLERARAARDEAMQRVASHSPASWLADAKACVRALAIAHGELTSDDVWAVIGQPPEPRALGPVMRTLAHHREIQPSGEYRQSTRQENHARPVAVWIAGPALLGESRRRALDLIAALDARYQVRAA